MGSSAYASDRVVFSAAVNKMKFEQLPIENKIERTMDI
jgi:hypothetical protein